MSSMHEFSTNSSLLQTFVKKSSKSITNSEESFNDVMSISLMNELVTAVSSELQYTESVTPISETKKIPSDRKNSIGDLNTLYSKVQNAITLNRDSTSHFDRAAVEYKAAALEISQPIENNVILPYDTKFIVDINDEIDKYGQIIKSEDSNLINLTESNKRFKSNTFGSPPIYKYLAGTNYVVDAFQWGHISNITGYFLTHFHSDHYQGIGSKFKLTIEKASSENLVLYCSPLTAEFLLIHYGKTTLDPIFIQPLPMNERINLTALEADRKNKLAKGKLDAFLNMNSSSKNSQVKIGPESTEDSIVYVTLMEACHCPGAVCFLFNIIEPDGAERNILHTGDFRSSSAFLASSVLNPYRTACDFEEPDVKRELDLVYLDTTYSSSKYVFPSQDIIITQLSDWIFRIVRTEQKSKLVPFNYLIVVGSYHLGKEKVFIELAKRLNEKIYIKKDERKFLMLERMMNSSEFSRYFDRDPTKAIIHVVPMNDLSSENLSLMLKSFKPHYTHILAIRPTGWTTPSNTDNGNPSPIKLSKEWKLPSPYFSFKKLHFHIDENEKKLDRIYLLSIPYSEHSSFQELVDFLQSFRIRRVIPTVQLLDVSLIEYFPK